MKFLTLQQYQHGPQDRVYRYSFLLPIGFLVFCVAVAVGLGIYVAALSPGNAPGVLYYLIGLCFVAAWFTRGAIKARQLPQNWLLTMSPWGLTFKFRSFRNHHFPVQDRVIVAIPYDEILWVREFLQKRTTPGEDGDVTERHQRFLEIKLRSAELTTLAQLLSDELNRKGPQVKTWYGHGSHRILHYPVRLVDEDILRIEWRVAPSLREFFQAVGAHLAVERTCHSHTEYTVSALQRLDKTQQEERIRSLAEQGDTILAIKLARQLYACSLADAKSLVEELKAAQSQPHH